MSVSLFKNTRAQNLIQNGSFELFDSIDCGSGGFDNYYLVTSPHVLNNWYGYQSPDYFNVICQNGPLPNQYGSHIPANFFGYSNAKSGSAYAGLVVYARGGYDKEYIYQQLSQPLQSGKVYCLSFYVNKADRVGYAIKSIGALFSNNLQPVTNGYEINTTPQVFNAINFISDTTQWTEIQGCFTANGGEQFITFGNFTTNFSTDTLNTNSINLAPGRENTSYYYIDDVTLIEQSSVGISELSTISDFNIYPNPSQNIINIDYHSAIRKNIKIAITNILGETVLVSDYKKTLDISSFQKGMYFVNLFENNYCIDTKKIIKD